MTDTNSGGEATSPHSSGLKIAIIGSCATHRHLAPFDDPTWEIWGCSANNYLVGANPPILPRVDAWFEIHSLMRKRAQFPDYVKYLETQPRVYLQQLDPAFVGGVRFPIEEVFAEFDREIFVSSCCYMIGLAILQKPAEIGLWGIDLCTPDEYAEQRLGTRLMIKEAERRGIRVVGPAQTSLLRAAPQYAYREGWQMYWALIAREELYQQRIEGLRAEISAKRDEMATLTGAKTEVEMTRLTWLQPAIVDAR